VSGGTTWVLVALGLGVIVVRRRSIAVGLVTVQAIVIALAAIATASTADERAGALLLGARGIGLAGLLLLVVSRTREPSPVRPAVTPLVRAGFGVGLALALLWLVPTVGLASRAPERAAIALVAFGAVTVATRRATLLQVVGIVLIENGLALAAIEFPGASSLVIEVGITLDLVLIVLVATVFHERIFREFGAGDTAALGALRD
jgi:hydrogenase-4 component E